MATVMPGSLNSFIQDKEEQQAATDSTNLARKHRVTLSMQLNCLQQPGFQIGNHHTCANTHLTFVNPAKC